MKITANNFKAAAFDNPMFNHFSEEVLKDVSSFQKTVPGYKETPLRQLSSLGKSINIGDVYVKDESYRFGLNAFKGLGGIYSAAAYLKERHSIEFSTFDELVKQLTDKVPETFVTATDGNHGKGIAWAAQLLNQRAVVYMPKNTSRARVDAIEKLGGKVIVTDMNYDDTVRYASKTAEENNWPVMQDTAWEGYEDIPLKIMQGYSAIVSEIKQQLKSNYNKLTHVFLQAGVGSFAGSIAASLIRTMDSSDIKIIIVEPDNAACLYKSAEDKSGNPRAVGGDLETMMAGLSCGEPSTQGWSILKDAADAFISCSDEISAEGMRLLGRPAGSDDKIISGESGSVTAGILSAIMTNSELDSVKVQLGLNKDSKVLLINTEGDTDPDNYREVMNQTN
ncbi:PLP-dependent lyase/thiolase [Jeotgalicoccus coquinae]|uniref:Diaminopropionate ammonia-lyase n=1 Tax=Jeotgalicoccus coquinae TaxID=709509 RepID=A0A6V7R394_9STAP|nr:diaminopropionate ammonia-lyase [Jeotgalicoccus coquinae]MBB6423536.1 diaminopropionate ammonia-lyase [Jeotgalicoccus coquinae]GGE20616.1 PLP-dependent lyase/thiolase [Jeotgalicoccus coquinae]CAD2071503.1 Diaminopropionate ammonia-lyase [Jeotgalicoccus coquinae]